MLNKCIVLLSVVDTVLHQVLLHVQVVEVIIGEKIPDNIIILVWGRYWLGGRVPEYQIISISKSSTETAEDQQINLSLSRCNDLTSTLCNIDLTLAL